MSASSSSRPDRRWGRAALGALLGGALLWMVLAQARGASVGTLLTQARLGPAWLLATGLWTLSYGLRAWRLQLEWRGRVALDGAGCWRTVVQHHFVLALLPMRLGEAGYVWALHRRWGIAWADAARSLLWLRVQDLLVLGTLAALAWAGLLMREISTWPLGVRWGAVSSGLLLLLVALTTPALRHRLLRGARALRAAGSGHAVADWGWLCCWANWLVKLTATACLFSTLMGEPSNLATLAGWGRAALAGEWAGALPLQAPAGLGSYEAALIWAAPSGGLAELAAAAVLTHVAALATLGLCALLTALWPERSAPAVSSPSTAWSPSTRLP